MDPTRTKVIREEYAKLLKRLPVNAQRRCLGLLKATGYVDDAVITQTKQIIEDEMGASAAKQWVETYNKKIVDRGSAEASRQLGRYGILIEIPAQLTDPILLDQLNNLTLDLISGLSDETKKKLAYELRDGWMQGEGITKLSNRVTKVFNASKTRAVMIARTESIRAFNQAAIKRYEQVGLKRWQWLTALDERTCPICMPLNGQIFKMGQKNPPPIHPRCRCTVVPIVRTDIPSKSEKTTKTKITDNPEIDDKIYKNLDEFDKILKKEKGNYSRAVNRFVNGRDLGIVDGEKIMKKLYKEHLKGASRGLKETIMLRFVHKVNPKVIDKAGKVTIRFAQSGRANYVPYISGITEEARIKLIRAADEWKQFLHEYGHHIEHEVVRAKSIEFYIARIKKNGYNVRLLRSFKKYKDAGFDEYTFAGFDHIDPYMGKFYGGDLERIHHKNLRIIVDNPKKIEELKDEISTEFISMGLQQFKNGDLTKAFHETDPESFGFMLSVIRGDFI